jgi:hypothetical protein
MIPEQKVWQARVSICSRTSQWDDCLFLNEIITNYQANGLEDLRERSGQQGWSRSGWNDLGGA